MRWLALTVSILSFWTPGRAADPGLRQQDLQKSLGQDWPTFNGDYSGRRYSKLNQINQENVGHLTLAWILQPHSVGSNRCRWR